MAIISGVLSAAVTAHLSSELPRNIVVNYGPNFIGGVVAGSFSKGKGWVFGAWVGFILTLIQVTLYASMISYGIRLRFGWHQFVFTSIAGIITASVGGIVGELARRKVDENR
ncbi:MAG: hypothetical protein ACREX3_14090 [Gammaproteobacteria bacterium]